MHLLKAESPAPPDHAVTILEANLRVHCYTYTRIVCSQTNSVAMVKGNVDAASNHVMGVSSKETAGGLPELQVCRYRSVKAC